MKTRLLMTTLLFSIVMIFSLSEVYAQENIETWNLSIDKSYKIPIVTENVTIDYIRANLGDGILMYLSMENSKDNGFVEFTFPEGAISEIFDDNTCDLEFVKGSTEFFVYVNQIKHDKIVLTGEKNPKLSLTLPSESSHVTIEGQCANVLSNPEHQVYAVNVNSHEFSIPYRITDSILEKITVDCNSTAMIIQLEQTGNNATLAIDIPRTLLDIQSDLNGNKETSLFTIVDGQEVEYRQIHSNSESRILLIEIPSEGKVLEIIASSVGMFPEPVTCGIAGYEDSFYHQLLSPLHQYKNGVHYSEIICKKGLELAIKNNDFTPACVSSKTYLELIKRGWVSSNITDVLSRDISVDPKDALSSYMDKTIPTLAEFKEVLKDPPQMDAIVSKFGEPHEDIGSGIHIYVYELNDKTQIWIGHIEDIWYVQQVDSKGNLIEELFAKIPESHPNAFVNNITEIINENHQPLRYYTTNQIISDTFLEKTVKQWQDVPQDNLP